MDAVSVSVVTYNSAEEIVEMLRTLFEQVTGVALTVFVADNASADGTAALVRREFPQVTVIENADNRGFGHGHNTVIPYLSSQYHLIVNPDIRFTEDAVTPLCAYLDAHPEAVMATPTILCPDGTPQSVPKRMLKRRYMIAGRLERFGGIFRKWRDEYTRRRETFSEPTALENCTGCFMLIRTALFAELGGFDERFFMYCEDSDLSRRALAHGGIVLIPTVSVTHKWEKASGKSLRFLKIHLRSMHRYFKKWRREAKG